MNNKGFTIIETLVAITVLMIAVAGPLVVASKGLFGATLSKNQMIASYLAQESMEVIKNARDNNLSSGLSWMSGFSAYTKTNTGDASATGGIMPCGGNPCQIYIGTKGYGNNSSGTASAFKRQFYIHAPANTDGCLSGSGECGITVEVYWNEAAVPYSVILTSEITDTPR